MSEQINSNENMDWVYSQLEDDESKQIYDNRRKYIESGDYSYIETIVRKFGKGLEPYYKGKEKEKCAELKNKKISIWGGGKYGKHCIDLFCENGVNISYVIDNDSSRWNQYYEGILVVSPEYFKNLDDNNEYYIIICSAFSAEEIRKQILENKIVAETNIVRYSDFMLASLKDQYFDEQILTFGQNEVLVDAGCYDLHTCNEFIKRINKNKLNFKKIYAFEPDNIQYDVCKQRINNSVYKEKFQLFKMGLWSSSKDIYFNETNDGSSYVTDEKGTNKIQVVDFDSIADEQVTFVKMDIEGSELEALKGMSRTICACKPKLAICIYHKPEDMWEIPMYLKKLVPEYRLFVRHYSNSDLETVLYVVV